MDELTKLAIKYGTDKWGKHHYTPVYFDMFKDRRESVKNVLEIGPAEGAGLKMFNEFFPNALIYGAEIDQERVDSLQGLVGIIVLKCDQSKKDDLLDVWDTMVPGPNDVDLIIDDGSHIPEHQIFTAKVLCPLLFKRNPDAIYIVEDVIDSTVKELEKELEDYDFKVVRVGKRYDDQLFIVRPKQ
jgi:hypothetical protein